MVRLFLILIVFMSTDVFSHEDASLEYSSDEDEPAVVQVVKVYPPIAPDALERIYNVTREEHRFFIARKKDMPDCLRDLEGPFPFYGHSADARLGALITDYFASLQFDDPEVREETKAMRLQAIKIKKTNIEEALKLLYISGWKMGDPESVKLLRELLLELRCREEGASEDSNLISVLRSYPKTIGDLIRSINGCRSAVDYRNRKERDVEGGDDDSFESDEEFFAPMIGIHEQYGLRRRHKSGGHK